MKISVTVRTRAKTEEVVRIDAGSFKVSVKEPPIQGRANEAVIKAIASFFDLPPSRVSVVSGHTSKKKILEIV